MATKKKAVAATTATGTKKRSDRYDELKQMLEDRRREILSEVQSRIKDVRSEGAGGLTAGVVDAEETSVADIQEDIELALIQMKAETLARINEALGRLEEGAAKAGDTAKTEAAKTKWYANANQIAAFLHKANPDHWPEATLQTAMKTHLDQTLDEATHRLQGKFDQDIKDYDAIVAHILEMADVLSGGIIAQFPAKFTDA